MTYGALEVQHTYISNQIKSKEFSTRQVHSQKLHR